MIVSSGQITITNLGDSKQLVSYIGSSSPKTVVYNPNTDEYTPNYARDNQILTPQLFIAGMSANIINQAKLIKWYRQDNSGGQLIEITSSSSDYLLGVNNTTLTIRGNVLESFISMAYICEIVFTDIDTGFDIPIKSDIEIVKIANGVKGDDGEAGEVGEAGQDSILATVWTPDGNTLKNSIGVLRANVIVYKGSIEVLPSAFKWYERDPVATTEDGGDIDGGDGWRRLTTSHNMGVSGYDSAMITIPASAIGGMESFKCVVVYNDIKYQDVVTVIDLSDPITVSIIGTSTFKNGQGESQFLARLYRNGEEIDLSGSQYVYSWSLYKSDGTASIAFGVKKGKNIVVRSVDFIERADLVCEISNN